MQGYGKICQASSRCQESNLLVARTVRKEKLGSCQLLDMACHLLRWDLAIVFQQLSCGRSQFLSDVWSIPGYVFCSSVYLCHGVWDIGVWDIVVSHGGFQFTVLCYYSISSKSCLLAILLFPAVQVFIYWWKFPESRSGAEKPLFGGPG